MSSKRRKEKSYSIHGMQSILGTFISRHQFTIKPYDSQATSGASNGCLFRCLKQFERVRKKKYIQWKIHRDKSTSLFQITAGYNQWCPRLHHRGAYSTSNSLKYLQYKQFPQYIQYKQFPQKEEKDEMEEKVVHFKRRKRGGWKKKWLISKKEEGEGRQRRKK